MLTTSASLVSCSKRLLATAVSGIWAKCLPIFSSTAFKGKSRFLGEPSMLSDGDPEGRPFLGETNVVFTAALISGEGVLQRLRGEDGGISGVYTITSMME